MNPGRWLFRAFLIGTSACAGSAVGPQDSDALRAAAALDRLADSVSVDSGGPSTEALHHAAELVRLTGHFTPITLRIDGEELSFFAVAEQLEVPLWECTAGGGSGGGGDSTVTGGDTTVVVGDSTVVLPRPPASADSSNTCQVAGSYTMRTLIAWNTDFSRVVRIVADTGASPAEPGLPDVMAGNPVTVGGGGTDSTLPPPSDTSAIPPARYPGFMGEYFVSGQGTWWAAEGTQENALLADGGDCTAATAVLDWAMVDCVAARISFGFAMRVEALQWGNVRPMSNPPSSDPHQIDLATTPVDGVRLTVTQWVSPPVEPMPPDSTVPVSQLRVRTASSIPCSSHGAAPVTLRPVQYSGTSP